MHEVLEKDMVHRTFVAPQPLTQEKTGLDIPKSSNWNEKECVEAVGRKVENHFRTAQAGVELCKRAVYEAIEIGSWLNLAKSNIAHGDWLLWLECNVPKLSIRTTHRYMLLANRYLTHIQNGEELPFQTLRQAYLIAGVIDEPNKIERQKEQEQNPHVFIPETISSALLPFIRWKHKVFEKSLQEATGAQLEQWATELREPYEAYVEVQKRLGR